MVRRGSWDQEGHRPHRGGSPGPARTAINLDYTLRIRPNGATECSHGWSGAAAQPPDAEPVETVVHMIARPEGVEEAPTDTAAQSNT